MLGRSSPFKGVLSSPTHVLPTSPTSMLSPMSSESSGVGSKKSSLDNLLNLQG